MAPSNPSPPRRFVALRGVVSFSVAAALFALSGNAFALATFPGIIQNELGMTCAPPCTICHTSPAGGSDTAVQPFVDSLLVPGSVTEENLPGLLKSYATIPCPNTRDLGCNPNAMGACTGVCDANGDGTGDIAQLTAGVDPNTGKELFCVTYGCGAHVAPKPLRRGFDGTAALAALGAFVVLASRFRRRR